MANRKLFDSDGESVDVKLPRRKRKRAVNSPPPSDRNKAPRRSGRVRRPPSPLEASGESGHRLTGGRRVQKSIETSPDPSPSPSPFPEMKPSPPRIQLPSTKPQTRHQVPVNSVQAMFDSLEHDLHNEQERSQLQLQEIDQLRQKLQEKQNSQAAARYQGPVPVGKRDKVIEDKEGEIEELKQQLNATRDLRTASRLALNTRDKELEKLRQKHRSLIKVAKSVTNRWGGMGELAQAVEDATE